MLIDYLFEHAQNGGWVLIPIFFVGSLGFYLLFMAFLELRSDLRIGKTGRKIKRALVLFNQKKYNESQALLKDETSIMGRTVLWSLQNYEMSSIQFQNVFKQVWHNHFTGLDRHLHLISVMAAVAPLLGLLGTVSGMVHTFVIITQYGNSNPVLMAGGISEALITTQAGLLIAFPLVIFKHQIEDRILWIQKQTEMYVTQFINTHYIDILVEKGSVEKSKRDVADNTAEKA